VIEGINSVILSTLPLPNWLASSSDASTISSGYSVKAPDYATSPVMVAFVL